LPELPEVETTRRGITPHVAGRRLQRIAVHRATLRWPVPTQALQAARGQRIERVDRRAKYLLLRAATGSVMIHLGMSGSLRVVAGASARAHHDHVELELDDGQALRLRDPRRFGSIHWLVGADTDHPLLAGLGPEPWSPDFHGDYLYRRSRGRRRAVKAFLMDASIVAGVGNIYATEALFRAGIHPARAAGRVGRHRYARLVTALQTVLEEAIAEGGTTLRDFTSVNGAPGYFRIALAAYGRTGQPCHHCGRRLRATRTDQRATVYCPRCQR